MNRYEFESLISDYLEGKLSYKKRKEFELYIQGDEDARSLTRTVEKTINQMNEFDKILTSEHFNSKLLSKIKNETLMMKNDKSNIFGFTPFYASIFSCLFVSVILIGYTLIAPGFGSSSNTGYSMNSDNIPNKIVKPKLSSDNNSFKSNSKSDSLDVNKKEYEPKKANKIKFVNY